MAKIQSVKLNDIEIREVDGEFEEIEFNHQTVPAMLTNYAIERGHAMGLIKGSLVADLIGLYASYASNGGSMEPPTDGSQMQMPIETLNEMGSMIDDQKITAVIYMACIGANRNFALSYDDFLIKYHADLSEKLQTYFNLISGLKKSDQNAFAKEFKMATKDSKKK